LHGRINNLIIYKHNINSLKILQNKKNPFKGEMKVTQYYIGDQEYENILHGRFAWKSNIRGTWHCSVT